MSINKALLAVVIMIKNLHYKNKSKVLWMGFSNHSKSHLPPWTNTQTVINTGNLLKSCMILINKRLSQEGTLEKNSFKS